jgi:hypothetical protein
MPENTLKSWLTEKIKNLYPEFDAGKSREYKNVVFIRQWASGFIRWTGKTFLLKHDHWNSWPLEKIIDDFEKDKGGVWCGGAASFLNKVYEVFGVKSAGFDFGINDPRKNFTHLANCVLCNFDGKETYSFQDCYFNMSLTKADTSPVDLRELIPLVINRKFENVNIVEGVNPIVKYAIFTEKEDLDFNDLFFGQEYKNIIKTYPDGRNKVKVKFYGSEFVNFMLFAANGTPFREKLRKKNLPVDFRSLFCFPRGYSGHSDFKIIFDLLCEQAKDFL